MPSPFRFPLDRKRREELLARLKELYFSGNKSIEHGDYKAVFQDAAEIRRAITELEAELKIRPFKAIPFTTTNGL